MLITEAENESSKSYLESVQSGNPRKENFEKGVIDKNVSYYTDTEYSTYCYLISRLLVTLFQNYLLTS